MIPYYRNPRERAASLNQAKCSNDSLDCTFPSIDLNPTCCDSTTVSAPLQFVPLARANSDIAPACGAPNTDITQHSVLTPPENRTCATNSLYQSNTAANDSPLSTTHVLPVETTNYYAHEDCEMCVREPRGPKLHNERPSRPKVLLGRQRSQGDDVSVRKKRSGHSSVDGEGLGSVIGKKRSSDIKKTSVSPKEDFIVSSELVDQWLDTGVGDVANEDSVTANSPKSNSNDVTISISISTTNNINSGNTVEGSMENTSVTMMPSPISPEAMTSRTLSPHFRAAGLDKALMRACGDEDDVYPETTPKHCSVWPDVIIQRPPDNMVPRVRSLEPAANWVYFTRDQLMRFFSDRQRMHDRITSVRTLSVVGDHVLMLAHFGIRLPATEEEDMDEIIFGTALDSPSPLFLLPHESFGHLAAQVVFCDNVCGALTTQRCQDFTTMSTKHGARVWTMCGVPFAVCDARTSMLLSLNEYAARALRYHYHMDDVPLQLHAYNAEDRRDLMLLLRMAPALQIGGELIGPDAFVYFLLQYNGTKSLADLHSEFVMRRVGKSRRKALDFVETDPLAVMRVFDEEMGQSAESIAQRLEILSEALERVKEEQLESTQASRDEEAARLLEESMHNKESQERLYAELEESQKDLGKWKSYADELLAELAKSRRGTVTKPDGEVVDLTMLVGKEGSAELHGEPTGLMVDIEGDAKKHRGAEKPTAHEEETLSVECGDIEIAAFMSPKSAKSSLATSENDRIHQRGLSKLTNKAHVTPQACCSIQ